MQEYWLQQKMEKKNQFNADMRESTKLDKDEVTHSYKIAGT